MCPMRIFLVLFSALLAFYFAWRNYSTQEEVSIFNGSKEERVESTLGVGNTSPKQQVLSKVSSGLWMLVDMASGRYLWKGLKFLERPAESRKAESKAM